MSNEKHYPLHPGQTQPPPYYMQVPTEEYEALKREVQQLRELTAGNRTTVDDVVEINTLTSEVKALREINAKAQEEIATLKENQRWRKFPDEKADLKPGEAQCVLAVIEYDEKYNGNGRYVSEVDYVVEDNGDVTFYEVGHEYAVEGGRNVILWRPLPKAPEGK